jgi:hypothetical protein
MAYPKQDDVFWTPLPKELDDWEVIDITLEDHFEGAENYEPTRQQGHRHACGYQEVREGPREARLGMPRGTLRDHLAHIPQRHPLLDCLDLAGVRLATTGNAGCGNAHMS